MTIIKLHVEELRAEAIVARACARGAIGNKARSLKAEADRKDDIAAEIEALLRDRARYRAMILANRAEETAARMQAEAVKYVTIAPKGAGDGTEGGEPR